MTNPNDAVGTNGAFSGRTSVNAFNDDLAVYTGRGILSGWATVPSAGMTVEVGGASGVRDVAIAEDNAGNKTTVNNISTSPISVTIPAAPASNSRIDSIVAYVDNPPQGTSADPDNPGACGLIVVSGTVAASPSAPSEATIRSAITSDGATGSTAYYVVLANVTVANGVTDITGDAIATGDLAAIGSEHLNLTVPLTSSPFILPKGYKYYKIVVCFDSPAQGGYINFLATGGTRAYCRRMMLEGDSNNPVWNVSEYDDVPNGLLLLGSGGTLDSKAVKGFVSATLAKGDDGNRKGGVLYSVGLWHLAGVMNSGYSTSETYFSTDKTNEDISIAIHRNNGSFSSVSGFIECYN